VVGTFLTSVGTSANAFLPFAHQGFIPAWLVVVFLLFAMVQLFAINSLDLYSSGVTLQALGVRVKRYQAVIIDSVICLGVTTYALFDSSFSTYLKDFVDVVIIWIAPWVAIYLVDWGLRKWRYVPSELQRVDRGGLYWSRGGVHWPAIIAQIVGMIASMSALYPTFSVPRWMNPITVHSGGADFSVFTCIAAGGIVYAALAWKGVRLQAERQDALLAGTGADATT
jgi:nucleobase:cation symporter-1, NCS1 family